LVQSDNGCQKQESLKDAKDEIEAAHDVLASYGEIVIYKTFKELIIYFSPTEDYFTFMHL
jgi:DUF1365 family protein